MRLELPSGETRRLYLADAPFPRLAGLAWLAQIPGGDGLLIPRCRSIHTIGMRFPIYVAFTSWPVADGGRVRVLALCEHLPPLRLARSPASFRRGAGPSCAALELPAGDAGRLGLAVGTSLALRISGARAGA